MTRLRKRRKANHVSSPYITCSGLTLKTPSGRVYEDANFAVQKGQVVAIFGTEGSGRTSLMLTLAGRMKAQKGSLNVAGFDVRKQYKKVRKISALTLIPGVNDVPENIKVDDILAAELQICGKRGRKAKVKDYLKTWELEKLSGTKFSDLEAYEGKYFDIALACVGDPQILMVDSIQAGLTQHQSIRIMKHLKDLAQQKDMTIFVALREYDIARYADAIVIMSDSAERQRQAVLAERGNSALCPIAGIANCVKLGPLSVDGVSSVEQEATNE